jgi:predicted dehydrogenase
VAVLGFWHVHAADYAQLAQAHPETQLVAVWDDDADRGRAAAAEFGVEYTGDMAELLGRDDVDAVTITTATSAHHEVMLRAADAGKHIFTEKLLAPTVAEAEAIVAATDAAGVSLVVSLPRLYHGYTHAVADVLAAGTLGPLTHGRVRVSHDGAVANWLPERFYDPEAAIGGALTDLGCHPVYLIQRFLGPDPDTVSATYRSLTERAVDDHAVVTVGYADGRIGVIEAGFVSPGPLTIELSGTEGTLCYSAVDGALRVSDRNGSAALPVPADGEDAFGQWVGHQRDGTRADDNLARAIELTRLVVAANEAAATGRAVAY